MNYVILQNLYAKNQKTNSSFIHFITVTFYNWTHNIFIAIIEIERKKQDSLYWLVFSYFLVPIAFVF
jgi:hypothetical protein